MLSILITAVGVVINVISQAKAFVTSVSACAGLWTWSMIRAAHLRYRSKVRAGNLPTVDYRMPGAPVTNWIALASLAFVVVLMATSGDTRLGLGYGPCGSPHSRSATRPSSRQEDVMVRRPRSRWRQSSTLLTLSAQEAAVGWGSRW